jgi:outer membrane receptor protein involved in Fe transport
MLIPLLCIAAGTAQLFAQSTVSGTVTDGGTQQGLPGVNIVVRGAVAGTITDKDGKYSLKVNQAPPFTITFSFIGFHTEEYEVKDASATYDLAMKEESLLGQEVVVSASRVEENILKSPVTIEKIDQIAIKQAATPDFFDALASTKGVQVNNGSLNFTAVNTRGFATIANTRFVQWVDGMDTQAPLLNFPTGSIMGLGELDAESLELIPGAASALYGPNAFNGIMIMKSKSPFEYQGLSAQVKQGITNSNAGGSNPYGMYSIRYAKAFNNKIAFKLNFSYMKATDWTANDYKTDRTNPSSTTDLSDRSITTNFDGLNLYGDESKFDVPIGGTFGTLHLTRTGFKESVLLDNRDAKTIKGDAAIHYRINDKIELIGAYRYGGGNSLYQGQSKYALRDFNQQFYKLELKGDNFFVRGYLSATDAGKSYNMDALGALVNESISPTATQWAPDYGQAYVLSLQGYTPGVPAGNVQAAHAAARAYADRNIYNPDGSLSSATLAAISTVRQNLFQKTPGGASFYDNSKLWHGEFYYNFKNVKWADIIVGGNFRQYSLYSNATIFDEAPVDASDPKRLFINQYGVYTQISKTLAEKLKLTGSIRYDKSDNFEGHVTPRFSAVYTANQNHNFRASFQTGFRNPDTQAQYIFFNNPTGIILGGVPAIASRYGIYNGGAYTQGSVADYKNSGGTINSDGSLSGGNQALLQTANVSYVKPEQLWAFEVGYKGVIASKVLVDLNYYYSSYKDFLGEQYVYSKAPTTHQGNTIGAGSLWYPYTNSPYSLTSQGIGLGLTYNLPRNFTLTGNYNYASFTGTTTNDFQANFNTPQNRYSVGIGNRKIINNLGFNVNFRYQDSFLWESSYGVATIPSYGVLDAQVSYKMTPIKSVIKIGGTNLGGSDYRTNFGSPFVGQMYYISLTFDEFLK